MSELISIIVPVYNVKPYISRCLDSILAQTYLNIEIIAVDDGSNDGSGEILDKYSEKHHQIRVIHQNNSGVTSARLHGVTVANGKWIGFIDADDYIEPEMYETLYKNAVAYNADISHCGYQLIHLDGNRHYFYNTERLVEQDNVTGLKDLIEGAFVEPGIWNKLYKSDLFGDILTKNLIDKTIKINEDLLMNYYLFSKSKKSVFYDFCPYHYIARKTSATRDPITHNRVFDPIKVKKIIAEDSITPLKALTKTKYICTCIGAYNYVISDKCAKHSDVLKTLQNMISEEKQHFSLLNRKNRIMAFLILRCRFIYPTIYNVAKLFSKKDIYY